MSIGGYLVPSFFSGLSFWGSEFLPGGVLLGLEPIRAWAKAKGLIWDEEAQCMAKERTANIVQHFSEEDRLFILIDLYRDHLSGELAYLEYPFVPIRTLIKKQIEIKLQWWKMQTAATDKEGNATGFGDLRFTFYYSDNPEEFASSSTATAVCQKFFNGFEQWAQAFNGKRGEERRQTVSSATAQTIEEVNHVLEIDVGCDVKAKFFKSGRKFDATLALAPHGGQLDLAGV